MVCSSPFSFCFQGPLYSRFQLKMLNMSDDNLFAFDFSHLPGAAQSNAVITSLNMEKTISNPSLTLDALKHDGFRFPDCKNIEKKGEKNAHSCLLKQLMHIEVRMSLAASLLSMLQSVSLTLFVRFRKKKCLLCVFFFFLFNFALRNVCCVFFFFFFV